MHHLLYVSQLYSLSILRPLQKAAKKRGDECAWFFFFFLNGNAYLDGCERLLSEVDDVINWKPYAVYVPGNVVPHFFPGVKVQVFHGLATDETGKKGHYRIRGFFDLYCTRNPDETEKFKALEKKYGHFRVADTGWPKLDPLFSDLGQNIRTELGIEKPIVLYASTFSPSLTSAPQLFDEIRELSSSGKWHWLVTLHPKMDEAVVAQYRTLAGPNLTFFESHEDVLPLMHAADAMLCDTSSIALEFQMLNKPLVTFKNKTPGQHHISVTNVEQIESALSEALNCPEPLMRATQKFVEFLHPRNDGRSSERVIAAVDSFIASGYGQLTQTTLNMLRKWKIRKQLGYYRF